jgi:hypothetical protein
MWPKYFLQQILHGFWLMASERTANGYLLWVAIYVKKLNWFTQIYMALISPLTKWIIYPAMLRGARRRWEQSQMTKPRNRVI